MARPEMARSDPARPSDPAPDGLARLFTGALDRQAPVDPERRGQHPCGREDLQDRRDLANQALYAAITDRGPNALLADHDDQLGAGEHGGNLAGWIWVTHTHPRTGRRHAGPPQDPQSAHDVLGLTRQGPTPRPQDQRTSPTTSWTQRPHHDPPPF
ncbi:MAG: hypothetical protein Q4P07_13760, partial [Ornithinimicrobium sp.]|uniref:hypothetical protein n=1 Tax=Ornithinimicrobium sp. TaxID=1977084 RepID=UPI0026DFACC7